MGQRPSALAGSGGFVIARRGTSEDESALYGLFDEAVRWLVARGQEAQWGAIPPSRSAAWRSRIHAMATAAELWLLEDEGTVLGALAVGAAPGHVPAIDQPELYVQLLITRRSRRGEDLGGRLLALAEEAAREAGAAVTRVDCWAGSPGLIGWYESKGFVRCGTFEVNGWPGQLFTRRLG